jgi:hypothetical protein
MTTENNKLLADFMGWSKKINKEGEETPFYNLPIKLHNHLGITQHIPLEGFVFDTDWNWLMQVVEKIESLGYKETNVYVDISEGTFIHTLESNIEIAEVFGGTKIENTYNACIEFVKWYNNQIS